MRSQEDGLTSKTKDTWPCGRRGVASQVVVAVGSALLSSLHRKHPWMARFDGRRTAYKYVFVADTAPHKGACAQGRSVCCFDGFPLQLTESSRNPPGFNERRRKNLQQIVMQRIPILCGMKSEPLALPSHAPHKGSNTCGEGPRVPERAGSNASPHNSRNTNNVEHAAPVPPQNKAHAQCSFAAWAARNALVVSPAVPPRKL